MNKLATYPAYGKVLADRMRWNNPPRLIFVHVGGDAFRSAQEHNKDRDISAMVLTPGQDPAALQWPVAGCPVVIEWDGSAAATLITELASCLLRALAQSVTVWPTWESYDTPLLCFDIEEQRWIQTRETIKTYYQKQKVSYVHA